MNRLMSKRNFSILSYWVLSWILLSNLFIFYRFVGLNWSENVPALSQNDWLISLGQATFIGLLIGSFLGFLDVFLDRKNYLHRISFGSVILIKSFGFFTVALAALFSVFYFEALATGYSNHDAIARAIGFFSSSYFMVIMVYLVIHLFLLNFIRQVSEKFGPGNLLPIFFGRYYRPAEEKRIFMFLDLKSSTQYAELLGHIKYSQLIQDCFFDLTPIIEACEARIYQYAGDAAILTWGCDKSVKFEYAALLLFQFREKLLQKGDYYNKKYGFVPKFKAGIHAGSIVAAEVGVIKKEIAYHGDTINTASRIQDQCNSYNQALLCSEFFIFNIQDSDQFETRYIDEFLPKGKQTPIKIFSIELT